VVLFLSFQFYSIYQHVCLCTNTIKFFFLSFFFNHYCSVVKLEVGMVIPPAILLLLRIIFTILGFLLFQINLRIAHSVCLRIVLSFMCLGNCILYLGYPRFWANIHLSVSTLVSLQIVQIFRLAEILEHKLYFYFFKSMRIYCPMINTKFNINKEKWQLSTILFFYFKYIYLLLLFFIVHSWPPPWSALPHFLI
jgi:hypothetical protein